MRRLFKSCFVTVALVSASIAATPVFADDVVQKAMVELKTQLNQIGDPKLDSNQLYFGSTKINDNYQVVDAIKQKYGGTATVFVKDGTNFIRISTNVMKAGQRAVGTPLDPTGPAKAAIDQGQPFYGPVDILGKIYQTGYEPITNPSGETVGIYYVGYSLE